MQMFEAMNRAIAANRIKPVIDKVFGFDEVQGSSQTFSRVSCCIFHADDGASLAGEKSRSFG
jgi:hypothetical protein